MRKEAFQRVLIPVATGLWTLPCSEIVPGHTYGAL